MIRTRARSPTAYLLGTCLLCPTRALAADPTEPASTSTPTAEAQSSSEESPNERAPSRFRFAVTDQASVIYNGNNRDTRASDVSSFTNDNFGLFNNRLDTQVSSERLVLALRLDTLWFYARPNPTQIALDMVEIRRESGGPQAGEPSDPEFFRQKLFEAGLDMSNRTINWTIPAKYSATYNDRLGPSREGSIKLTVGDYYGQFGRGFVLSVRKQDAIASDTTLRGARATYGTNVEKTRIKTTLLAGVGNPLRVDETSGRYLGVHRSALRGLQHATEAGMPRAIETDYVPDTGDCLSMATCSYAPDNLYGAQIQVAPGFAKFETQASLLTRHTLLSTDVVRVAQRIFTASQGVDFRDESGTFGFYFEGAGQERHYELAGEQPSRGGYALYTNVDIYAGPLQIVFEGKHYRAFYPLSAGVDTARAPQFSQVQYSVVPTTEPVWNTSQFENFNTCTTGGRTQVDVDMAPGVTLLGWVGHYNTWAESLSNEECVIDDDKKNRIWDLASGTEISSRDHKSHTEILFGVRDDRVNSPIASGNRITNVFYRESYLRYDALFHVSGPYSLQFQGWHRYRRQTLGGPLDPWVAGQTINALEIAPFGNIALGIEYDMNPITPDWYFNGQLTYRVTSATNVSLFVGQRRGALRCVAGVCRLFPPFEGARLDLTIRL